MHNAAVRRPAMRPHCILTAAGEHGAPRDAPSTGWALSGEQAVHRSPYLAEYAIVLSPKPQGKGVQTDTLACSLDGGLDAYATGDWETGKF
jgi:hypothetical protein